MSDIEDLFQKARLQELINKAQHIVFIESVAIYLFCFWSAVKNCLKVSNTVNICGHNLCHSCEARRMPPRIVVSLKQIVTKRRFLHEMDKLVTSSSAEQPEHVSTFIRSIFSLLMTPGLSAANVEKTKNFMTDVIESLLDN